MLSTKNMLLQLGQMKMPLQIVWGAHARDADKKVNSVKLLVSAHDQQTIGCVQAAEAEAQALYPNLKLNSCLGPLITNPDDPNESGYLMRVKLTKNSKQYYVVDPWDCGAALTLDGLGYGHTCVCKCKFSPWEYKSGCGITIYANMVKGVGCVPQPWGRPEKEGGASPQEAVGSVDWS